MLPRGISREEVPSRLKLYEQCRKPRAEQIQEFSRIRGRDASGMHGPPPTGKAAIPSTLMNFAKFDEKVRICRGSPSTAWRTMNKFNQISCREDWALSQPENGCRRHRKRRVCTITAEQLARTKGYLDENMERSQRRCRYIKRLHISIAPALN